MGDTVVFQDEMDAAMDGDFIMTADEVQPVLHALRKAGIHIIALHNHMIGTQPDFYFTHFWGRAKRPTLRVDSAWRWVCRRLPTNAGAA